MATRTMTTTSTRPALEKIATLFLRLDGLIAHLDVLADGYNVRGAKRFQPVRLTPRCQLSVVSCRHEREGGDNRQPTTPRYSAASCSLGHARGSTLPLTDATLPLSS